MKTFLLFIACLILPAISQGQGYINFEKYKSGYWIDSVKKSIWQVGKPQKQVFDSAMSAPNVIITDILFPVPANDTSIFYLWHLRDKRLPFHVFSLDFYYQMDGDSSDFGTIEMSSDTGKSWINIMTQDTIYNFKWWFNGKPVLNGSSNGWKHFYVDMTGWSSFLPDSTTADTLLFRFTYITDSDTTPHDGWMLDNISLYDWYEGIDELNGSSQMNLYPNPVSGELHIDLKHAGQNQRIRIFDCFGKLLYDEPDFDGRPVSVQSFSNGIYTIEFSDSNGVYTRKFMVQH